MKTSRSTLVRTLVLGATLGMGALLAAQAQTPEYPVRPIKLIVPFAPGGLTDGIGRQLAAQLSIKLGQPVVVDNRAGAGGQVGTAFTITQPADGYTLVLTGADALAMGPALKRRKPYDASNDLTAVSLVANSPLVLAASAKFSGNTLSELIAMARANPDRITYGSAGVGSALHLGVELLQATTGTKMVHIPYQGGAPMMQALISNQVDFVMTSPDFAARYAKSGQSRSLAQADSKRHPLLPDVPTADEQGMKDMVVTSWFGIMGPAHLPRHVVDRLDAAIAEVTRDSAFQQQLIQNGAQVSYLNAAQFHDYIGAEVKRWAQVVQKAQIPLQD